MYHQQEVFQFNNNNILASWTQFHLTHIELHLGAFYVNCPTWTCTETGSALYHVMMCFVLCGPWTQLLDVLLNKNMRQFGNLQVKFKTLFMSDDIGRLDSLLYVEAILCPRGFACLVC